MSQFEQIHDCPKCHGKIVCITIDSTGITRCGYCNSIIDYSKLMNKEFIKDVDEIVPYERLANNPEFKKFLEEHKGK